MGPESDNVLLVFPWMLGSLLLVTGAVTKLADNVGFQAALRSHPRLKDSALFLAGAFPPVELLIGLLLAVAPRTTIVAGAASLLFLSFFAVTVSAPPGGCGCGPFVPARRSVRSVLNLLLSAVFVIAAISRFSPAVGSRMLALGTLVLAIMSFQAIYELARFRERINGFRLLLQSRPPR